jgi:hypothetical protein
MKNSLQGFYTDYVDPILPRLRKKPLKSTEKGGDGEVW